MALVTGKAHFLSSQVNKGANCIVIVRAMSTPTKNRSDTAAPSAKDMIGDSGVIQGMTEALIDVAMEKGRKDGIGECYWKRTNDCRPILTTYYSHQTIRSLRRLAPSQN